MYQAMVRRLTNSPSTSTASSSIETPKVPTMRQEDIDASLLMLKPEMYFKEGSVIDQQQCRRYESDLKSVFSKWCHHMPDVSDDILLELSGTVMSDLDRINEDWKGDLKSILTGSLVSLISGLNAQGWLPALVFNFERRFCEEMARLLLVHFNTEDDIWRKSSRREAELAKYHREMQAYQSHQEKLQKKLDKQRSKMSANKVIEIDVDEMCDEPVHPDSKRDRAGLSVNDLDLSELEGVFSHMMLIAALRRGIGVHHAGLNKKYRQVVERLFRSGHLKVVFATGSLAMGINMPCKTVVFAGDSPYLTPLMYRQMAGRSGRRGYDPLGRVVFWGLRSHRIRYLLGSHLTPIMGHFSLNVTWVLRALSLASLHTKRIAAHVHDKPASSTNSQKKRSTYVPNSWDMDDEEQDVEENQDLGPQVVVDESTLPIAQPSGLDFECMSQVFRDSLFVHQGASRLEMVELYLKFSLQLLVRMSLIDLQGIPQGLAGIAVHLHFEEPANLALCRLLASPHLWELCLQRDYRSLVILLAHMFDRKPISHVRVKELQNRQKRLLQEGAMGDLILPPLAPSLLDLVKEHDQACFDILNSVIHNHHSQPIPPMSSEQVHKESSWLPLSDFKFPEIQPREIPPEPDSVLLPLHLHLANTRLEVQSRSPCIAIGGFDDRITYAAELASLRSRFETLPFGTLQTEDFLGQQMELNAYALDFFTHGNKDWLVSYNGMRDDDLFFFLGDFGLLLQTICASLSKLSTHANTDVISSAFTHIRDEFMQKYYAVFMPYKRDRSLPSIIIQCPLSLKMDLASHIQKKIHIYTICKRCRLGEGFHYRISCRSPHDYERLRNSVKEWMANDWKILS